MTVLVLKDGSKTNDIVALASKRSGLGLGLDQEISNSFGGAGHTARYHSVGGPHCF